MRPERLRMLAHIAEGMLDFFNTKEPGNGDHATAEFVRSLREAARGMFPALVVTPNSGWKRRVKSQRHAKTNHANDHRVLAVP